MITQTLAGNLVTNNIHSYYFSTCSCIAKQRRIQDRKLMVNISLTEEHYTKISTMEVTHVFLKNVGNYVCS